MENHESLNKAVVSDGRFVFNGNDWQCAVGRTGVKADKVEGDGATPSGSFKVLKVLYRPDKIDRPETTIPVGELSPDDGWCDEVGDENYNLPVKLLYLRSHEELWRSDDVYDIIGILDYNYPSVTPGKGSAVFLHVARENYSPTAGCVAMSKEDLLAFLKLATPETIIEIQS